MCFGSVTACLTLPCSSHTLYKALILFINHYQKAFEKFALVFYIFNTNFLKSLNNMSVNSNYPGSTDCVFECEKAEGHTQ